MSSQGSQELIRIRGHDLKHFYLIQIELMGYKSVNEIFNKIAEKYGKEFTEKLKRFHAKIKDDTPILIVDKQGSICELGCPFRQLDGSCYNKTTNIMLSSAEFATAEDKRIARKCGVKIGRVYTARELKKRLKRKRKILFRGEMP